MLLPIDLVVWNKEVDLSDKNSVGSDLASLGELAQHKVGILPRIIVTPNAFLQFLVENNLYVQIKHLLGSINHDRHDSLTQVSSFIEKLITHSKLPDDISDKIFAGIEKLESKEFVLEAFYFQDEKLIETQKWDPLKGEAVIAEFVRIAWAHLFSPQNLKKHTIHHENHQKFTVCLSIAPKYEFSLTGTIKTFGSKKSEQEIEAHTHVRFSYNKHSKSLTEGHVLSGGNKNILNAKDIKKLLSYAFSSEKQLYHPQTLQWGKSGEDFVVTNIIPTTEIISYDDSYSLLTKSITVTPGITIGRLKVIDKKQKTIDIMNDEIVLLRELDKNMMGALRKAKGLIIEDEPHPEIVHLLKEIGIPTVIRPKNRLLFSTGDVISLNAATGEIRRGSMLVS